MLAAWLLPLASAAGAVGDPPSIRTDSRKVTQLRQRIQMLEQYVQFRRHYLELEFDLFYQNNGGGLIPGPSDFDIRLLARVPKAELSQWRPARTKPAAAPVPQWVRQLPGNLLSRGMKEWYISPGYEVGIDSQASIVAFRRFTR